MNPISRLLIWEFLDGFHNVPQQSLAKFASRVKGEYITGENQTEDILPQVDGVDYDPTATNIKFRPSPVLQFQSERVGFQRYAHTWNYAIATEDLARINPSFRMAIPKLTRASFERFKDRILAGKSDGERVTVDSLNLTAQTKNSLPANNRYVVMDTSSGAINYKTLDLEALIDTAGILYGREVQDPLTGGQAIPVMVSGHGQIISMLKITQVQSGDFNRILPLTRGDINGFCGFEFIRTAAVGKVPAAQSGIYVKGDTREVKLGASTGFSQVNVVLDKVLACYPMQAFCMGIYPMAGWTNIWNDPTRAGAWTTQFKEVISWKRTQNEYVQMIYAKSGGHASDAPIKKTPQKGALYYTNTDGNDVWDYS